MALVNNFFEMRSDAFKITVHNRRPIPSRTDTIGPWLDALTFLTWLGALTNSALVYLFCPRSSTQCASASNSSSLDKVHQHLFEAAGVVSSTEPTPAGTENITGGRAATKELLMTAVLIALAASHGYLLVKAVVKHIVERVVWKGSEEVKEREREEREIKESFLKGMLGDTTASPTLEKLSIGFKDGPVPKTKGSGGSADFWDHDEGIEEIQRISKEA